jgi:hypothetical protein
MAIFRETIPLMQKILLYFHHLIFLMFLLSQQKIISKCNPHITKFQIGNFHKINASIGEFKYETSY